MKKEIEMTFEKATKNTYRYLENNNGGSTAIGILYIQKAVFEGKQPSKVKLRRRTHAASSGA